MDYYCKCKKCEEIDPTERDGYKWYCQFRKTYEDPDEVKECKYYCEDLPASSIISIRRFPC